MRIALEQLPSHRPVGATALLTDDRATALANTLKALGDPVRLRLVALIAAQKRVCVCELTPHFQLSGATISHHLKVLREAGLIDSERKGTWVHYWVRPEAATLISTVLAAF
jgi:ArsR family transcriptional regulator, arsenate/arsenite/antimonite-responsive transcriptional repressor